MDEIEKKFIQIISRGVDGPEEYEHMKENNTEDPSEVGKKINEVWDVTCELNSMGARRL